MTVRFRAPTSDEIPAIHDIWQRSLTADVEQLHADWAADGDPLSRALVAVHESGELLAVVCIVSRRLRTAAGQPELVGGIAALATHPDARRRGYARQLLERALDLMIARGCSWSLLFTGLPEVYAPLGWRLLPQPAREGELAPATSRDRRYRVSRRPAPDDWSVLADVYTAFNRHRPLTAIRELRHWESGVGARLMKGTLFVAESDTAIVGYASAIRTAGAVELLEIATRPECPGAIEELGQAVGRWAQSRHCDRVVAHVPRNVPLDSLLAESRPAHAGYAMAHPLRTPWIDIEEAAQNPSARFWLADAF